MNWDKFTWTEEDAEAILQANRVTVTLDDIGDLQPDRPGLYEFHTRSGIPLKVGIAADVRRRLRQHAASRQSALLLKPGGNRDNPTDVLSKQSVLAKHLYYDRAIAPGYDLTTEAGRRCFLHEECVVRVLYTRSRSAALDLERELEASGRFRYVGPVVRRGDVAC